MKNAMLEELVKMIYFDYTVQLEVINDCYVVTKA